MRVLLRDLAPGQTYAVKFRSNNGDGGVSEWSQLQTFTTTNDTIAPSPVSNLSWADTGDAFIGSWDRPTTDAAGNPLRDLRHYRVNVSWSGNTTGVDYIVTGERFSFTREMNLAAFTTYQTALILKVYAVDLTYNESTVVSFTASPSTPPTPSTPTISSYLGAIVVNWNGLTSTGAAMPSNFVYCEVHVGTTSGFTPSTATYKTRIMATGSDASAVLTDLAFSTTYYAKLIAVNTLGRQSVASVSSTAATQARISGLDITDNSLSTSEINFTALDIGGANAYYVATTAARDALTGVKSGDIAYITGSSYDTYRYNGTTWVAAPEIGMIYGQKIVVGALTGDKIATNFFAAALTRIGTAYIDEAYVNTVNAASITTGQLRAATSIIAGSSTSYHAEMTDTGFYVKGPDSNGVMRDRIRMGVSSSDFFGIPNPTAGRTDETLASIDEAGNGTFQNVFAVNDVEIAGRPLVGGTTNDTDPGTNDSWFNDRAYKLVGSGTQTVNINPGVDNGSIRSEYGLASFSFPVVNGRAYEINIRTGWFNVSVANTQVQHRMRTGGGDGVTATITSDTAFWKYQTLASTQNHTDSMTFYYHPDYTGTCHMLYTLVCASSTAVVKVASSDYIFHAFDVGINTQDTVVASTGGGTLLAGSATTATPAKKQYYAQYTYNWIRSYQGSGAYMTNTNSRGYQGQDPSGFNGNQSAYYGFSHADFATLLSGATVDKVYIYLYYAHWYNNSGGTAEIRWHNVFSDPGTAAKSGTTGGLVESGNWPKPGGRDINVTSLWGASLKAGTIKGVALGPGPSTSPLYYGYATDCKIKIWYTK